MATQKTPCNMDCLHCIHPDCINQGEATLQERKQSNERMELTERHAYMRAYNQAHKDECQACRRAYYQAHREERLDYQRAYRKRCKEERERVT